MYTFDFSKMEIYEIGAALVTMIAFPNASEEKQSRFHSALCSEALRSKYEHDQEWGIIPQLMKPAYVFHPINTTRRDMNTINRQLQYRLWAAHIAIVFLKEAESGKFPPDFPKEAHRLSLNEMIRVLKFGFRIDINNFETRVWRPSLPVIHLAAALAVEMGISKKETSLGDLVFNKDIITFIVQEAERYEQLLPNSKLLLNMEKLIKVRLINSSGND